MVFGGLLGAAANVLRVGGTRGGNAGQDGSRAADADNSRDEPSSSAAPVRDPPRGSSRGSTRDLASPAARPLTAAERAQRRRERVAAAQAACEKAKTAVAAPGTTKKKSGVTRRRAQAPGPVTAAAPAGTRSAARAIAAPSDSDSSSSPVVDITGVSSGDSSDENGGPRPGSSRTALPALLQDKEGGSAAVRAAKMMAIAKRKERALNRLAAADGLEGTAPRPAGAAGAPRARATSDDDLTSSEATDAADEAALMGEAGAAAAPPPASAARRTPAGPVPSPVPPMGTPKAREDQPPGSKPNGPPPASPRQQQPTSAPPTPNLLSELANSLAAACSAPPPAAAKSASALPPFTSAAVPGAAPPSATIASYAGSLYMGGGEEWAEREEEDEEGAKAAAWERVAQEAHARVQVLEAELAAIRLQITAQGPGGGGAKPPVVTHAHAHLPGSVHGVEVEAEPPPDLPPGTFPRPPPAEGKFIAAPRLSQTAPAAAVAIVVVENADGAQAGAGAEGETRSAGSGAGADDDGDEEAAAPAVAGRPARFVTDALLLAAAAQWAEKGIFSEDSLDLASCRAVSVRAVLTAAQANPALKAICIAGGQLWALEDVQAVLAACPGLKVLEFDFLCRPTDKPALPLLLSVLDASGPFAGVTRVRRLVFRCPLPDENDAVAFARAVRQAPFLQRVEVKGRLAPAGLRELAAALGGARGLRSAALDGVGLALSADAEHLAENLRRNSALTELSLCGNSLGDAGVTAVAKTLLQGNETLTRLDLSRTRCTGQGAAKLWTCLRSNSTLRTLRFAGNKLSDAHGATELGLCVRNASALEALDLSDNELPAGHVGQLARALAENKTITRLVLRGNDVGDDGARSLANALRINRGLVALDLGENGVTASGALELAAAARAAGGLKELALEGNEFGEATAELEKARSLQLAIYL